MAKFKVGVHITEKDLGWGRIKAEMEKLAKKPFVKIGVQGAQAKAGKKFRDEAGKVLTTDKIDVVQVAKIHEFGAKLPHGEIPERSFIRSTMQENAVEFKLYAEELYQQILLGKMTTEVALGRLGEKIQAAIQAKFVNNDWAPLAPSTLGQRTGHVGNKKLAGVHRPLIDTGQLRQSIRWVRKMNGRDDND